MPAGGSVAAVRIRHAVLAGVVGFGAAVLRSARAKAASEALLLRAACTGTAAFTAAFAAAVKGKQVFQRIGNGGAQAAAAAAARTVTHILPRLVKIRAVPVLHRMHAGEPRVKIGGILSLVFPPFVCYTVRE